MTLACESCGAPLTAEPKFCPECGERIGEPGPSPVSEARKLVTILFADASGSTSLGEQIDPETMRFLLARYFAVMKRVIEAHGGRVEKFVGDAVMAVFGIPTLHEDDALRAVRAAAEIATELASLDAELEASHSITIRFRTGINTGEVVVGAAAVGQTLVTGDAVNTAARLQQAAAPGETLLGRLTWQLVRDAVDAELVEPLALKGKTEPVEAHRLLSVRPGAAGHARRLDTPLVGRERELARLEQAFRGAVEDRACHLFTLLGSAGIGKSRLTAEFADSVAGAARVLRGRCLPYGEGITYWAIGEIVRAAAEIDEADSATDAQAKIRALLREGPEADRIAAAVEAAIGLSADSPPQEDVFWGIRKFLEHLAAERPLAVVIEDIHWAEQTLLDVIEHVADWSRDAPILLLCPARPELLDVRTGWAGGKLNATTILLEPLAADATARLIDALPGGDALPAAVEERITRAAEGNPLFVEEMLGVLRDDGLLAEGLDGTWRATAPLDDVRVPASISTLLATRLEGLPAEERAVAERASVVGRVFERAAVAELAPDTLRPHVDRSLLALVRKDLIRPERSDSTAGDTFKFRHILIHDAAYERLPKADRATLHERFAEWLERTTGERVTELEEILGFHLGSAFRYRTELGESGRNVDLLADRARARLASAGRRALDRGDVAATVRLLTAAVAASRLDAAEGREVHLDLAAALGDAGRFAEAKGAADAVMEASRAAGDARSEVLARVICLQHALMADPMLAIASVFLSEFDAVSAMVEAHGDHAIRVEFTFVESVVLWDAGRLEEATVSMRRGLALAEQAGMRVKAQELEALLTEDLLHGPTPVDVALVQLDASLRSTDSGPIRALTIGKIAILRAMQGDFDGARAELGESRRILTDLGHTVRLRDICHDAVWVERLAGDHDSELRAVDQWRALFDGSDGERDAIIAGRRAHVLSRLGRMDEARSELALAEADDFSVVRVLCHLVRGRLLVGDGRSRDALLEADHAERVARGVEIFRNLLSETLVDVAWIATRAGDRAKARAVAEEALRLSEAKGNVALAGLARSRLEEASD
jgi:class 3 adenylate cyclase/tetratricopeptide (TPR) repeat protein